MNDLKFYVQVGKYVFFKLTEILHTQKYFIFFRNAEQN